MKAAGHISLILLCAFHAVDVRAETRASANARIEQFRKGGVEFTITRNGSPAAGATVRIEQKSHDFRFGVSIDRKAYGSSATWKVAKNYGYTVEANCLKWRNWDPAKGREGWDKTVSNGQKMVRGHTIFWGRGTTAEMEPAVQGKTGSTLRDLMKKRVSDAVGTFKGKIGEWDINNEMILNNHPAQYQPGRDDYYTIKLGPQIIKDVFTWVHDIDPSIMLTFNEFGIAGEKNKAPSYASMVKYYLERQGIPKGKTGLNIQAHMDDDTRYGERLEAGLLTQNLMTLAAVGVPIQITEFDYSTPTMARRAQGVREFYTACFAHPSVVAIYAWEPIAGTSWKQNTNLYTSSGGSTEASKAYTDLAYGEWWTNASITSSTSGSASTRVFFGEHTVTVSAGGATVVFTLSFSRSDGTPRLDKTSANGFTVTARAVAPTITEAQALALGEGSTPVLRMARPTAAVSPERRLVVARSAMPVDALGRRIEKAVTGLRPQFGHLERWLRR